MVRLWLVTVERAGRFSAVDGSISWTAGQVAGPTLALSPCADSSSISSKARTRVSRRHSPQNVPPPRVLPLTR